MGCDIHLYVERKVDGKWVAVKEPVSRYEDDSYQWDFSRSYRSFALLADVRNGGDVTPLSAPRGIPADVSDEVLTEYVEGDLDAATIARYRAYGSHDTRLGLSCPDWHSASTFTLAELGAVALGDTHPVAVLREGLKALGTTPDDVRIVFWFDN